MAALLGMAGLAEAALAGAMCVEIGGLALLALAVLLGLATRSRLLAIGAMALSVVLAVLFPPWQPFSIAATDDPDASHWISTFQCLAMFWALGAVAAIGSFVIAFAPRWRPGPEVRLTMNQR